MGILVTMFTDSALAYVYEDHLMYYDLVMPAATATVGVGVGVRIRRLYCLLRSTLDNTNIEESRSGRV